MQGLDKKTKSELLELVRMLEHQLEEQRAGSPPPSRPGSLDLDFVCAQALQVLDNSGIPAFVYDTGADSPQSDRRLSGTMGPEFKLLAAFVRRRGRILTREQLLDEV